MVYYLINFPKKIHGKGMTHSWNKLIMKHFELRGGFGDIFKN